MNFGNRRGEQHGFLDALAKSSPAVNFCTVDCCAEIFPLVFVAIVLTFFIAGLLIYLCLAHVDNLGAYTASRPETGLLIPSDYANRRGD